MALYLVEHTPKADHQESLRPPSDLRGLAHASQRTSGPRWISTWSPDLHDDRLFTLWEADNAAEVEAMIAHFHFLDDYDPLPLRVKEWGPADVLAAEVE